MVAIRCSPKYLPETFHKIYREIPVLESLFNTVKGIQVVRLATLLMRDLAMVFQNQIFVDVLQNRCS